MKILTKKISFLILLELVLSQGVLCDDTNSNGNEEAEEEEYIDKDSEISADVNDVIKVLGSIFARKIDDDEAENITETIDPDDDQLVTVTDLRNFLKENNVNNSRSVAEYLIEEASNRALVGLPGRQRTVIDFEVAKAIIHEKIITQIILHREVRHRKIVSLSIVGAFRKGKSFLLDYMLRYLYATYKSINTLGQEDETKESGEWIGEPDEALKGFSWKPGVARNTTGIVLWSDVFLYDAPDGEKYAIMIIDTQGLFDHDTPAAINGKIFSFTTLITSFQIFNLANMIQEDHLEYLQFATEFSRFSLKDNAAAKPFQNLLFLIRDWANDEIYSFGYEGGEKYLEEAVFKIKPTHHENMKRLRTFIKDSFESIKCFLMPHPGSVVAGKGKFNGSWGVIDEKFVDQLKVLIPSMLAPENLSVKKIAGEEMTGQTLYWHMQFYLQLFQSSKFPTAKSIYDSTVAKFLQDLVSNSAAMYKELMTNGTETVETHSDFDILALSSKNEAVDFYNNEKKIGDNKSIIFYRNSLIREIGKLQAEHNQTTFLRIQNNMKDRELEEQRNATLHEIRKVEELRKKQELTELQANETMVEMQKNIRKIEAKNQEISGLQDKLQQQKNDMDEAIRRQEEKVKAIEEDQKQRLIDMENQQKQQLQDLKAEQAKKLNEIKADKEGQLREIKDNQEKQLNQIKEQQAEQKKRYESELDRKNQEMKANQAQNDAIGKLLESQRDMMKTMQDNMNRPPPRPKSVWQEIGDFLGI